MSTLVPMPTLTATGFLTQPDSAILTGVISDIQAAFGGTLNLSASVPSSLTTPQGQLASSISAIVSNCFSQFLQLASQTDPQFAQGVMQDAIGNIYFMQRIPASGTTVSATVAGLQGTVIPAGVAVAQDIVGNLYSCATPAGGVVTLPAPTNFVATTNSTIVLNVTSVPSGAISLGQVVTGPGVPGGAVISSFGTGTGTTGTYNLSVPATASASGVSMTASGLLVAFTNIVTGAITYVAPISIYQTTPGWSNILSPALLLLGQAVETQQAFEARRQNSVAANSLGGFGSVKGAVLTALASAGTGTSVYVTENSAAQAITVGGVTLPPYSIYIACAQGAATNLQIATAIWKSKGNGCSYAPSASVNATVVGTTLTVNSTTYGVVAVGQSLIQTNGQPYLTAGGSLVTIISGSGPYTLSGTPLTTITGAAILTATTTLVQDTSYASPYPSYYPLWTVPANVPIYIQVTLVGSTLPMTASVAAAAIAAQMPNAFSGADGGVPVQQIGATVFGSRFFSTVAASISNPQIISIMVNTSNSFGANPVSVPININQLPTYGSVSVVLV